ncbi:MAG: hypothetical protein RL260_4015, partial [Pseudomonadota bacterium]
MHTRTHTATRLLAGLTLALAAMLPAHATSNPGEGKIAINYPTGNTDFGVHWHADIAEFGSTGTVNYIIHKG